jgi:adenine-specific DNA-methyltransferase
MRYIGNKTRLLPFLLRTIDRLGIEPGRAHDAFAGTAAVGRALKARGWSVASSDIMTYAYVFQRAYVVASRVPRFTALVRAEPEIRALVRHADTHTDARTRPLAAVCRYLASALAPERGLVASHFAPLGGRMYFTDDNAGRIDAARHRIEQWRRERLIDEDAYYLLLAALLEGADRVANTAGVYAAYIKSWQPNAVRPLNLVAEPPVAGPRSQAHQRDAATVARRLGRIDLLYIDPPYNTRQYAGYYHVPELLARGASGNGELRGKTGLPETASQRSRWCSRRDAPSALRELLAATGATHVLVSYNTEGVIPDAALRAVLRDAATDGVVRRFTRPYRRYRADSDRDGRRYKADSVRELLYYARLR